MAGTAQNPVDAEIRAAHAHELLFTTSAHCIACHSQVKAPDGKDISIGFDWRASIMGNAGRDPYWQASVRRETLDHPMLSDTIEDKCTTCHLPMERFQVLAEGGQGRAFRYFKAIHSGAALVEPEGNLHNAKDPMAALAGDGVSCTLCHQIQPTGLGRPESLDGHFVIDTKAAPEHRVIFGPFAQPDAGRVRLMHSAVGYTQVEGDHIKTADLCASCHTLYTDAVDDRGRSTGRLPEQVPFFEWKHSVYSGRQTCQDCHMDAVPGAAPITSIHQQLHEGVKRHTFVGGNSFMLRILKDHANELGVAARPEELEASAQRSLALLRDRTASVAIGAPSMTGGRLTFDVTTLNRAGHKLPTAYPARRAWLHETVRDANGGILFESGAPRPDGSIAGNDNDADKTRFEPYYSRITSPDQVEIYESILGDWRNRVTTGLLYASHYLKDDRLLPEGFDKATADPQIAVIGDARDDPRFAGGRDDVTYSVALTGGRRPATIDVELLYESIGYRWAHNFDPYAQVDEPNRFLAYYNQYSAAAPERIAAVRRSL